ncbi:MAG: hypothetical protein Harvfovirus15_12 [Harvfovirus sp.]|uniref:Hedgehog/Intein (Hint) domain-containing protein n=1 Tax=Harvfovirus sp. TaxID=2487768 RepID=A0A3G5A1H2_9VIRU|nr:MAG: hypothetical protein Harvfovirus15_12 [Harvfovirus sp.]
MPPPVTLGPNASLFGVLAIRFIINAGNTVVDGYVGADPGTVTGFPPGTSTTPANLPLNTIDQAQGEAETAYNQAISLLPEATLIPNNLSESSPLAAGIYTTSSGNPAGLFSFDNLTLTGSSTDFFVFIIPGELSFLQGSSITLEGGINPQNIFWAVEGTSSPGFSLTIFQSLIYGNFLLNMGIISANLANVVTGRLISLEENLHTAIVITSSTVTACFLRGTKILTPTGYIPVESLKIGDLVQTKPQLGTKLISKKIKWIGKTTYPKLHPSAKPICIKKDAIAANMPNKDLYVSPQHAIYFNGKLICAKLLVNNGSIFQDERITEAEYYHIELDKHALLIAEGLATESFLDTGCRLGFDNASSAATEPIKSWKKDACAPLIHTESGARYIQKILSLRSTRLGYNPKKLI